MDQEANHGGKDGDPPQVVLRVKQRQLSQTCDSKCVEEAGHNSEACFCTGKMQKADRT